jgi:hypothetical protein
VQVTPVKKEDILSVARRRAREYEKRMGVTIDL